MSAVFAIPQNKQDEFYNLETITVAEALASPRKRKLSLQAEIVEVLIITIL